MGIHIRPRTQRERRDNADPDMQGFVRGKRTPRNIPTAYDDRPHSRGGNSKPKRKDHR